MNLRLRTRHVASLLVPAAAALSIVCNPSQAHAQFLYNAYLDAPSGSVSAYTLGNTSSTTFTPMMADDITVSAGNAGKHINSIQFGLYNSFTSGTSFSVSPILNFYAADGTSGGPGSLLYTVVFGPITVSGSTYTYGYTYSPAGGLFDIPANGNFWVGEAYTNLITGDSATAAQLQKMGVILPGAPTVGTSSDKLFLTAAAGAFQASNPTGTIYSSPFGGNPVGNLAFGFSTTPEPSSIALAVVGLFSVGGGIARRRRSRA